MTAHVLVTDPDPAARARLAARLRAAGHRVSERDSSPAALQLIKGGGIEAVLLAEEGPGEARELLEAASAVEAAPGIVVLARRPDVRAAVELMRLGADDVLDGEDEVERALADTLRNRAAASPRTEPGTTVLIGDSPAMRRVHEQIERVAAAPKVTTLVLGESGVGKELVARAVHERSQRASGPFVALNCAALTEGLLEAELFGYEPGSFTGADRKGHRGLFAAAEGGTLFLDEIGELALGLQAKLLRVLQEGTYRRVGGTTDRTADVRVISSTNRDLEACVEAGTFREDLFYRLNVLSIRVPPLRERASDVPLLAAAFLSEFSGELGRRLDGFSEGAMRRLLDHPWPGNVRELKNTVERGALMVERGRIQAKHLGLRARTPSQPAPEQEDLSLQAVERAHIRRVIQETAGNRSQAARLLGVNRTTLYNKLRRYGLGAGAE